MPGQHVGWGDHCWAGDTTIQASPEGQREGLTDGRASWEAGGPVRTASTYYKDDMCVLRAELLAVGGERRLVFPPYQFEGTSILLPPQSRRVKGRLPTQAPGVLGQRIMVWTLAEIIPEKPNICFIKRICVYV